jgi:hypothetical protein
MDDMDRTNEKGRFHPNPERKRRTAPLETDSDSMRSETSTNDDDPQREFWGDSREIENVVITFRPPIKPLAILEKLGPSPFERGSFPLIGFLATTFDKVGQFALERAGYEPNPDEAASPTDISNR